MHQRKPLPGPSDCAYCCRRNSLKHLTEFEQSGRGARRRSKCQSCGEEFETFFAPVKRERIGNSRSRDDA